MVIAKDQNSVFLLAAGEKKTEFGEGLLKKCVCVFFWGRGGSTEKMGILRSTEKNGIWRSTEKKQGVSRPGS